ncbi:Site-specific DNA-methyltransferase (Adenine-specific) [Candidatus Syntrophocurvum alkaliphilum]|uniref:Site-specific DNA-methyltransferase (Adenine-specific) n=1 Tax=Candidatus Syntrophocurvum alkaliphilum TaxID=2293317 RepID=A0A6I6DF96_9FIRM|nr:site-specific DNA-methyltransferase [Candidatus Syntrophocurvum alkaliphilum]QGT99148.1 Site-specific DNA-methyltransferase (Adenine-specific) [Candidatus Syntrophocurvum alkaliphilum]
MSKKKSTVQLNWETKNKQITNSQQLLKDIEFVQPNPIILDQGMIVDFKNDYFKHSKQKTNKLIKGDNLSVINALINQKYSQKIDLIYLDPPYFSNMDYTSNIYINNDSKKAVKRPAFKDTWEKGIDSYLDMMYQRLVLMKELLSDNGSIFVHLDWHINHYVKILLDEIFTPNNFINEIIWCYGGGSNTKKSFQKKHDTILWYAKGLDYIFNPQYRPYTDATRQRGLTKVKGEKYKLNKKGALMQDWWIDINKILSPTAKENLKYPTQKPEPLLKRIISTASNENSLVADFFCGSGTLGRVCDELNRQWIMCDDSNIAINTCKYGLITNSHSLPFLVQTNHLNENLDKEEKALEIVNSSEDKITVNINLNDFYHSSEIEYLEIDPNYNGKYFCSNYQFISQKRFNNFSLNNINIELNKKLNPYNLAAKATNVYGNNKIIIYR